MTGRFLSALGASKVLGGLYLGWGIGANDSANIFGPAVATNSVRYRTAIILIAIFVFIGAMLEGPKLYDYMTFSQAASSNTALAATLAAALTITIITYLAIPTSTSQAAVGSFMGMAIATSGVAAVEWGKFSTMLICWILNPIAAGFIAFYLIKAFNFLFKRVITNFAIQAGLIKTGLIGFGCYGAYTLGANNVVVTTAPYYHAGMFGPVGEWLSAFWAATLGGASIAVGALTYSRRVMITIGKKITPLDALSALVVVLTHSLTLHFFTQLDIPVSSSQAVVGAVIGVGLVHGARTIAKATLMKIFIGWISTPLVAAAISYCMVAYIIRITG